MALKPYEALCPECGRGITLLNRAGKHVTGTPHKACIDCRLNREETDEVHDRMKEANDYESHAMTGLLSSPTADDFTER